MQVLIGIVATLIVGALFYFLQIRKNRYRLIIEISAFFSVSKYIIDKGISLNIDGILYNRPVYIISYLLINVGNKDISSDDLLEPIKIILPKGSEIIKVIETPEKIKKTYGSIISNTNKEVNVGIVLLKKNESIPIELFVTPLEDLPFYPGIKVNDYKIKIESRIKNIYSIEVLTPESKKRKSLVMTFILGFIIGLISIIVSILISLRKDIPFNQFFTSTDLEINNLSLLFFVGIIFCLVSIIFFVISKLSPKAFNYIMKFFPRIY